MRRVRRAKGSIAGLIGIAVGLVLASAASGANLQRVEAVGIYGIRGGTQSRVIPRDEAIAKARWEGVSRVALELIGESAPPDAEAYAEDSSVMPGGGASGSDSGADEPSQGEMKALRAALGKDLLPYTQSYRILDDRGEVPALFNDEPNVKAEYVVVVEVIVDVDRLEKALAQAGLIAKRAPAGSGEEVLVEVVGLSRYEALEMLLDTLRRKFGATRVRTLEFSQGRQLLAVEGPFDPDRLLARLGRFEHPRLELEPLGVDPRDRRIRLMGRWSGESAAKSGPTS